MREIRVRLRIHEDGRIEANGDDALPPGEHEAVAMIREPRQGKPFSTDGLPVHYGEWDHSVSLRREDMYGDDGR